MKKRREIKKVLLVFILLSGLIIPLACSDNNSAPTKPSAPSAGGSTNTPTGTVSTSTTPTGTIPTSTSTPTFTPTGAISPSATFTITWTPAFTPAYDNNYGTSAGANGMYYDGTTVYVAEAESKAGIIVNALEQFTNSGGGVLVYNFTGNIIVKGQATPCIAYTGVTQTTSLVNYPMGLAVSSPGGLVGGLPGMVEILDASSSGGATLYAENNYFLCPTASDGGPFSYFTPGFGGASFNNPKCLTADTFGHFYVADTGNGYVDEFDGGGTTTYYDVLGGSPLWLHRWNGSGGGFGAAGVQFKVPNSLACDTFGNVYVGDSGPYGSGGVTTSMVQIYSSGGTSILGSFTLIPGCVVNGLTVDNTGDFYVSDTNNGEVEQYQIISATGVTPAPWPPPSGTVYTQVGLRRAWGDPHSYHEFVPYVPSCLQFIGGGYIVVGDTGNDFLNVFGP